MSVGTGHPAHRPAVHHHDISISKSLEAYRVLWDFLRRAVEQERPTFAGIVSNRSAFDDDDDDDEEDGSPS